MIIRSNAQRRGRIRVCTPALRVAAIRRRDPHVSDRCLPPPPPHRTQLADGEQEDAIGRDYCDPSAIAGALRPLSSSARGTSSTSVGEGNTCDESSQHTPGPLRRAFTRGKGPALASLIRRAGKAREEEEGDKAHTLAGDFVSMCRSIAGQAGSSCQARNQTTRSATRRGRGKIEDGEGAAGAMAAGAPTGMGRRSEQSTPAPRTGRCNWQGDAAGAQGASGALGSVQV